MSGERPAYVGVNGWHDSGCSDGLSNWRILWCDVVKRWLCRTQFIFGDTFFTLVLRGQLYRSHFVFLRDCHGRWLGSGLVNLSRLRLFSYSARDMEQSMGRPVVFRGGHDWKVMRGIGSPNHGLQQAAVESQGSYPRSPEPPYGDPVMLGGPWGPSA